MNQQKKRSVELIVADSKHLEAHRKEFLISLDDVLTEVKKALALQTPKPGSEVVFTWKTRHPIGTGGLARVYFWTKNDYWAPRNGRTILSHLIRGRRPKIKTLCIWGRWDSEYRFLLHTVYPGKPAPREIHDSALTPETMREAVRFWSKHAIITGN